MGGGGGPGGPNVSGMGNSIRMRSDEEKAGWAERISYDNSLKKMDTIHNSMIDSFDRKNEGAVRTVKVLLG